MAAKAKGYHSGVAVPTTLHIGRPCMQCTPGRGRGPGWQACRRAASWVRRGVGGGRHAHPAWGGGGRQGGGRGGEGGGVREGRLGGGSRWGDLEGGVWGEGGAQAPLTSPCPPSNHTITINPTLTFAAS